ncbi:MAG: putative PEP-binding protein [Gammaproteobacteria bacterium]
MSSSTTERRLRGVPVAPGVARGRLCFLQAAFSSQVGFARFSASEAERLIEALSWLTERLKRLAADVAVQLGAEAGEIFWAQHMLLEDPALREALLDHVKGKALSAEQAVVREFERCRRNLARSPCGSLRERAVDFAELKQALLDRLRHRTPRLCCSDRATCPMGVCQLHHAHIVVAVELTPVLAVEADPQTVGFLVERSARNSHAAILARALNLPTVSGIESLFDAVPLEAECLIDGDTGELIVHPCRETVHAYELLRESTTPRVPMAEPVPVLQVMATIDQPINLSEAVAARADGVGLTRTEMVALAKGGLPGEVEQEAQYREIVEAMSGKPAYVRLWDLGCDKAPLAVGLGLDTSLHGCRGARYLLKRPELLRTQARALARASQCHPIHVVYPMVSDPQQYTAVRDLFQQAIVDLPEARLYHGIMFEIPSACLQARELFDIIDFGCIGTNDLIQYLFAIDRGDESADYERLFDSPILWRLIADLVRAAEMVGKPLSICGELAGEPRYTQRLLDVGIKVLSATPRRIASVRRAAGGVAPSKPRLESFLLSPIEPKQSPEEDHC